MTRKFESVEGEELIRAIENIKKLDKAAQEEPAQFSQWELEFVGQQAARLEEWGENILISPKVAAVLQKIADGLDHGSSRPRPRKPKEQIVAGAARYRKPDAGEEDEF